MPCFYLQHIRPGDRVSKKTFVVRDEDYELLNEVFPERGFNAHLPGLFYNLLANKLREKGITNVSERFREYADIGGLLSDILIVGQEDNEDDRRGTSEVHSGRETAPGKSANTKDAPRKGKRSKRKKDTEES